MPTFPLGKGAYININSVDYSDSFHSEDAETKVAELDNTVHGPSFHHTKQPGLVDDTLKATAYYSQAVYSALRTLCRNRTIHTVIYGPEGNGTGKERTTYANSFIAKVGKKVPVDKQIVFDIEWGISGDPTVDVF